jgi:hypothetical protein
MSFGIEDNFAQVERVGRSIEQVEVLESLGEEEAFHFVFLGFLFDVTESRIGDIGPAIFDQAGEERLSHIAIAWVVREVVKIIG